MSMLAKHRAELLALIHDQAPHLVPELTAYAEDDVLFAAAALSLVESNVVKIPANLERMLNADMASDHSSL